MSGVVGLIVEKGFELKGLGFVVSRSDERTAYRDVVGGGLSGSAVWWCGESLMHWWATRRQKCEWEWTPAVWDLVVGTSEMDGTGPLDTVVKWISGHAQAVAVTYPVRTAGQTVAFVKVMIGERVERVRVTLVRMTGPERPWEEPMKMYTSVVGVGDMAYDVAERKMADGSVMPGDIVSFQTMMRGESEHDCVERTIKIILAPHRTWFLYNRTSEKDVHWAVMRVLALCDEVKPGAVEENVRGFLQYHAKMMHTHHGVAESMGVAVTDVWIVRQRLFCMVWFWMRVTKQDLWKKSD